MSDIDDGEDVLILAALIADARCKALELLTLEGTRGAQRIADDCADLMVAQARGVDPPMTEKTARRRRALLNRAGVPVRGQVG